MKQHRRPRGPRLRSVEIQNASVRLGRHWALRDASFVLKAGERWVVTGPNGAGKTVLLKLLRGDLWPTPTGLERRIYRLGRECTTSPARHAPASRISGRNARTSTSATTGTLRSGTSLAPGSSIPTFHSIAWDARGRRAVESALTDAGLAGLAARRFLTLSYGQRRRVLLARALVRRPDVLLLDEALNGLDKRSRRAFLRQLRRGLDPRAGWMLTTHRAADAPRGVTHVAQLESGRIVHAGPARRPRMRSPVRRRAQDHSGASGSASGVLPAAAQADAWNDVHIVCQGTGIKTVINGVTVADYDGTGRLDDETHRSRNVGLNGHIGLQIHPGKELLIRFKDVEVRPL